MIYVRGHKEDFDSWERLGCTGWGWNNVLNYFKKMEDYFMPDGMPGLIFCIVSLLVLTIFSPISLLVDL